MELKYLILCFLFSLIKSECILEETCPDHSNPENCNIPFKSERPPSVSQYSEAFACPEYAGENCCTNDQNFLLSFNFNLIDYTFGSKGSGCDLCAANMKRFWCAYTCSKFQKNFVTPGDVITVKDPTDDSKLVKVQNVTIKIDSSTACELFESCKKVPYATQVSAMGTAVGFLNFQGTNAVKMGKELINFIYVDKDPTALKLNMTGCGYKNTSNHQDPFGYPVYRNCTCNDCEEACTNTLPVSLAEKSAFTGVNWIVLIIVYGAIVVETASCILYRKMRKKNRTSTLNN